MTPRPLPKRPPTRLLAALLVSAALLAGCRDQTAARQTTDLTNQVQTLTQERDRLNARITADAEQRADMQNQIDSLRAENDQLKAQIAQGASAQGSGAQGSGTQGSQGSGQAAGNSTTGGSTAAGPDQGGASTGSTDALGADSPQMAAARTYAKNVYDALQARIAEDPVYTPETVAKDTPDCTQATAIGENGYGKAPAGVDSCRVEPAGDHDFKVTLDVSGQEMVVGPGAQP